MRERVEALNVAVYSRQVWRSIRTRERLLTGPFPKLIITFIVVLAVLLSWGVGAAILLGLLAASVIGLADSRLSLAIGIACIACCPLVIIAEQGTWLQQSPFVNYYISIIGLDSFANSVDTLTTWAFYFISIGLIARIVHYAIRDKASDKSRNGAG